jgi:hypothetical protein
LAELYGEGKVTEQDIISLKSRAELVQYSVPENNAITYMQ